MSSAALPWERFRNVIWEQRKVRPLQGTDGLIVFMKDKYGFKASKAQYEAKLREWGLGKSVKKEDWKTLYKKLESKKRKGQECAVYQSGELVPAKRLKKEISRHGYLTYAEQIEMLSAPSPKMPSDFDIRVILDQPICYRLAFDRLPILLFKLYGTNETLVPQALLNAISSVVRNYPAKTARRTEFKSAIDAILPMKAFAEESGAPVSNHGLIESQPNELVDIVQLTAYLLSNGHLTAASLKALGQELIQRNVDVQSLYDICFTGNTVTAAAAREALFRNSVTQGDSQMAVQLLRSGVNPNNHPLLLQGLKHHGLNGRTMTPLQYTCITGQTNLTLALVKAGASLAELPSCRITRSILVLAIIGFCEGAVLLKGVSSGSASTTEPEPMKEIMPVVTALIAAGARINFEEPHRVSEWSHNHYKLRWEHHSPLSVASAYSQLELVRFLLHKGADTRYISNLGNSALHCCLLQPLKHWDSRAPPTAQLLLSAGADCNRFSFDMPFIRKREEITIDRFSHRSTIISESPLEIASRRGSPDFVNMLIGYGAQITEKAFQNALNDSYTLRSLLDCLDSSNPIHLSWKSKFKLVPKGHELDMGLSEDVLDTGLSEDVLDMGLSEDAILRIACWRSVMNDLYPLSAEEKDELFTGESTSDSRFAILGAMKAGNIEVFGYLLQSFSTALKLPGEDLNETIKSCWCKRSVGILQEISQLSPEQFPELISSFEHSIPTDLNLIYMCVDNVDHLSFLISLGLDVNALVNEEDYLFIEDCDQEETDTYWNEQWQRDTAINRAVYTRNEAAVLLLLRNGACPNSALGSCPRGEPEWTGITLVEAVRWGNEVVLAELLKAGANPNALGSIYTWGSNDNCWSICCCGTSITAAAAAGNIAALEMLLAHGGKLETPSDAISGRCISQDHLLCGDTLDDHKYVHSIEKSRITPLAAAVRAANVEMVEWLLSYGLDPLDAVALSEATGLKKNKDKILGLLLNALEPWSDLNKEPSIGVLALHHAALRNDVESIHTLAEHDLVDFSAMEMVWIPHWEDEFGNTTWRENETREDDYETPLGAALRKGNVDAISAILNLGADPNKPCVITSHYLKEADSALGLAVGDSKLTSVVELLLEKGSLPGNPFEEYGWALHETPLQRASSGGNVDAVRLLLKYGADVDEIIRDDERSRDGECLTPLQLAASRGCEEILRLLLEYRAAVNGLDLQSDDSDFEDVSSPLQVASREGFKNNVDLLLEHGADVNAGPCRVCGATALQFAAMGGYLGIVHRLVEMGADVNAKRAEKDGRTALEGAAEHGRLDVVQYLLNSGAEINSDNRPTDQYLKALERSSNNGHHTVRRILEEHYARIFRD